MIEGPLKDYEDVKHFSIYFYPIHPSESNQYIRRGGYVVDSFLAFSCLLHLLIWILKTKRFLRQYWNGRNFCWPRSSDLPYLQSKKKYVYVLPLALYTIFLLDIQIYSAPAARST